MSDPTCTAIDQNTVPPSSPTTATEPAANSGHDSRGRFTKGNKGGPGNPFARQAAQMRKVLLECVSEDDLRLMMQRLVEKAKEGDLQALRLVLAYAVGRPGPAVDPDRVDVEEFELFQQEARTPDEFLRPIKSVPIGLACNVLRATLPSITAQYARTAPGMFQQYEEQVQAKKQAEAGKHEKPDEAVPEQTGREAIPAVPTGGDREEGAKRPPKKRKEAKSEEPTGQAAALPTVEQILSFFLPGPQAAARGGDSGIAEGGGEREGDTDSKPCHIGSGTDTRDGRSPCPPRGRSI
jgi:hypothetical protein